MRLRSDGVSWQALDDEVVILDLDAAIYFTARGTAAALLQMLETDTDEERLVAGLLEEYDVDVVTATIDVQSFIATLHHHRLLAEGP
ncbi:MAG: PqqD family protein [Actinomycetota bacterium]